MNDVHFCLLKNIINALPAALSPERLEQAKRDAAVWPDLFHLLSFHRLQAYANLTSASIEFCSA
jgi:hypothetical protein